MRNWNERANLPSKEGFFWARTSGMQWWNLIVKVQGTSPFFTIDVWDYTNDKVVTLANVHDIEEFGPEIAGEAPKIERRREDWS